MTALIRVVYSREVQLDLPGWGRAVGRVWHVCESDHSSRAVSESRLRTGRPDRGRSTPPARAPEIKIASVCVIQFLRIIGSPLPLWVKSPYGFHLYTQRVTDDA